MDEKSEAHAPRLWIKLDLRPDGQIGPGKIALLRKVGETRSISAAARALRMSYRRAWLLTQEINATFREPAVVTSIGGASHGGASLTAFGEELVARYDAIAAMANDAARGEMEALSRLCASRRAGGK